MDILDIKKAIKELSYSERRELLEMLERSAQSHELTKEIEEARFSAKGIYCPRCGGVDGVVKFGRTPKGQRYRCKDCGRTFTAMSLSLFQGTHKALTVWGNTSSVCSTGSPCGRRPKIAAYPSRQHLSGGTRSSMLSQRGRRTAASSSRVLSRLTRHSFEFLTRAHATCREKRTNAEAR